MKEITIKIPDEALSFVYQYGFVGEEHRNALNHAILQCAELSKGHGKIIEVTPKLEAILDTYQRYTGIDEAPYEYASEAIAKAEVLVEADKGDEE